jgi:hypothetical protein
VIAHEVGHHVQNLLGVTKQVHDMRGQVSEEEYNALSVRLELQADFYAGVWAHHVEARKHILEAGDIDEALQAATAIGDDRLQKRSQGSVVPESFTHGTSEQRARWFRLGFETGDPARATRSTPAPSSSTRRTAPDFAGRAGFRQPIRGSMVGLPGRFLRSGKHRHPAVHPDEATPSCAPLPARTPASRCSPHSPP